MRLQEQPSASSIVHLDMSRQQFVIEKMLARDKRPRPAAMPDMTVALNALRKDIVVERAESDSEVLEAKQLRHEVFCQERNILPGLDDIEQDGFDEGATHIIVRRRRTGEAVGTVRLLPYRADRPEASLPMQKVCPPSILAELPLLTTGEVSRFSLSRRRREPGCPSDGLLRLALLRGILTASLGLGLTHWCAAMEPSLLRLLRGVSINFNPVGPLIEYCGVRQPAVSAVASVVRRVQTERADVFSYVKAGWSADELS